MSAHRALSPGVISCGEPAFCLGLPLLDAMLPAFAQADTKSLVPRRFFGICNNLGVLPDKFFPDAEQTGRDYTLSPYLEHLQRLPFRFHGLQRRLASRRGRRASRRTSAS